MMMTGNRLGGGIWGDHEVLFAYRTAEQSVGFPLTTRGHGSGEFAGGWLGDVEQALRPAGYAVCRTHSAPATIQRVELGGLAAAVLVADDRRINALSLLRIIRSIDDALPCWLVTDAPTRQTLQVALSLRAMSVMSNTLARRELSVALMKALPERDSLPGG